MKLFGLTGGIATGKSTVSKILKEKYNCTIIDADKISHEAFSDSTQTPYQDIVRYFNDIYGPKHGSAKGQGARDFIFQKQEPNQETYTSTSTGNSVGDGNGTGKDFPDDKNANTSHKNDQNGCLNGKDLNIMIDRVKLGKIAFSDPDVRKALNNATHSWIFKKMMKQILSQLEWCNFIPSPFMIGTTMHKVVILDVPLLFETNIFTYFTTKNIVVYTTPELQLARLMERDKNVTTLEEANRRINAQMSLSEKCKLADFVIDNTSDFRHLEEEVDRVYKEIIESCK